MSVVAVAVCPHPPLLIPEVAAGAAAETESLRTACVAAIQRLVAANPDIVVVVGNAQALDVAARLLDRSEWRGPRRPAEIAPDLAPADAVAFGRMLAGESQRLGLLVMGDGSARRSVAAPGYLDERAEPFDSAVAAALANADTAALTAIDADLARDLLAAGRASWQVLAGAAGGNEWQARVSYDDAPYGVGYFVAEWWRA